VGVEVEIPSGSARLGGLLEPAGAGEALVLFAHGSGSSRHSPRNQAVARALREAGVGTLLFDLLTRDEEAQDRYTAHLRFDVGLLADRLVDATIWALGRDDAPRAVGYFGASTGAAAALIAAATLGERIGAIVSRGGRPDLAGGRALTRVVSPTLLIVGALDSPVIVMNEQAYAKLECEKDIALIPAAGHLFEEPRALEAVAAHASTWFSRHLLSPSATARASEHAGRIP
jgi:putative phosphoribosyl transferase